MADLAVLIEACRLGQMCRLKCKLVSGMEFKNHFPADMDEHDAWRAGYTNDLALWIEVQKRADKPPAKLGRLRAHDAVVFNAHTSFPDHGEFLGYDHAPDGWCRVLLWRQGFKTVPMVSLTRPVKRLIEAAG